MTNPTSQHPFYKRACETLGQATTRTSAPKQSTKCPSAEELIAQQSKAKIKGTVSLIPEELSKEWAAVKRNVKRDMAALGKPVTLGGGSTRYIMQAMSLPDTLPIVSAAQQQMRDFAKQYIEAMGFEVFRNKCLADFGELDHSSDKAFPYQTVDDYCDDFTVGLEISGLEVGSNQSLPAEVSQIVMAQNMEIFDKMLDYIRHDLIQDCIALYNRLGTDQQVTKSTFNKMVANCEMSLRVVGNTCPHVERIATGFPKFVAMYDGRYNVFGPSDVVKNEVFDPMEVKRVQKSLTSSISDLTNAMVYDPADL